MSINTYVEALTYIYSYIHYNPFDVRKNRWNLDRMQDLLARLGAPEKQFPSLLIAGTKGKGSTAAISESILRAAGYKTGLYTSPHLHSFRERIRLGGELIPEATVVDLTRRLRPYFEATPDLTVFELMTALAVVAFAEARIDVAVLEVGLGGRLDATNAVDPTVAVITSISYDHTQILGETLTLIAREKAGIIRPGALVISAPQVDEAMNMIEEVCLGHRARLVVVDRDWRWQNGDRSLDGQSFTVDDVAYWLPLIGKHQVVNAITALAALEGLAERAGLVVSPQAQQAGIANVRWLGRTEFLNRRPYLMVDSAMNGDSAEKLVSTLNQYFPAEKKVFIFGASSDHPIRDMLAVLLPVADKTYAVAARHPRAENPVRLAEVAAQMGRQVWPIPDMPAALDQALVEVGPAGLVCVTGSLFLVADAREAWLRRNNLPLPPIDPMIVST
ncbi:MAG: folylpolyglutamate synthase/dihydrofolate synthase family protein [Chloroflexota bacterium]